MFDKSTPVSPFIFGEDMIFDERGSTFLAMRRVQWVKEGDQPNEENAKLELRKWIIDKDGKEQANKGFSFLTEDGPNELAKGLISRGYGDTKEILEQLVKREDFRDSVEHLGEDQDDVSGDYFDMRNLLSGIETDSEEDDVA